MGEGEAKKVGGRRSNQSAKRSINCGLMRAEKRGQIDGIDGDHNLWPKVFRLENAIYMKNVFLG